MTWLKRLAMSFLAKDYISEEYCECFVEKPEEFEFSRGQKKLIQEIVDRKLFQGEFDTFSIQARI